MKINVQTCDEIAQFFFYELQLDEFLHSMKKQFFIDKTLCDCLTTFKTISHK